MTTKTSSATDEAQIRGLIDDWARALRAKDINRPMTNYAPDVVSFDVVNPLQRIGVDAAKKRAEKWISSWQGPIHCEIRDLSITTTDDAAFSPISVDSAEQRKAEAGSTCGSAQLFATGRSTANGR